MSDSHAAQVRSGAFRCAQVWEFCCVFTCLCSDGEHQDQRAQQETHLLHVLGSSGTAGKEK